jgi:uncharacterized protein
MVESTSAAGLSESPLSAEPILSLRFTGAWTKLGILVAELGLAFGLGWAFSGLQMGGLVWLFAGIIAAAVVFQWCRWRWATTPNPNRLARKVGLALVGLTIGCSIRQTDLQVAAANLPIFGLLTGLLLLSGLGTGILYARLQQGGAKAEEPLTGQNYLEALLATVPGGVGVMASLAADYGCNVTQVVLVQILRVSSVVVLIPLLAGFGSGQGLNPRRLLPHQDWFVLAPQPLLLLLLALGLTALVVRVVQLTRLPVAPFLGGLLAGVLFLPLLGQGLSWMDGVGLIDSATALNFRPPPLVGYCGQILLGLTIGEYWASHLGDRRGWQGRAFAQALLCVGLTLATGFCGAILAHWLTDWDWLTCLLVTAPGGAPEMILVGLALHHPIETITAGHVVRLIGINCSLPLWLWLAPKLPRQKPVVLG